MSKIFSDNSEVIRDELNKIKDNLLVSKVNNFDENFDVLEAFYDLYGMVFDIGDEDAFRLLKNNSKSIYNRDKIALNYYKEIVSNFIKNRDFNIKYSERISNKYCKEFKTFKYKDYKFNDNEKLDIMQDFLEDEFHNSNILKEMIDNGRLFRADLKNGNSISLSSTAFTMFNFVTNHSFIVIDDDETIKDMNEMSVLMHEFGHVIDNLDRSLKRSRKDRVNYNLASSYIEVYSLLYERLFYEYLIKNNICVDNAKAHLCNFYSAICNNFITLYDLSLLHEYYEKISGESNITFSLYDNEEFEENGPIDAVRRATIYGYGGLLSNYLANIKKENPDRFNIMFNNFSNNRFSLFNEEIFSIMGTNKDEVLGYLNKDLKKMEAPKKIILK